MEISEELSLQILDELDNLFLDRLEEKYNQTKKFKFRQDTYLTMYDRERKRIEKKLEKETVGTVLLGMTKEEVKANALHRIEKENPTKHYYDQKGKKYWIRYREDEFVCDAYIMIRSEKKLSRQNILEYIHLFFIRKGYMKKIKPITIDSLNTILKRARISDDIIDEIKELRDSKILPTNPH